MRGIIAVRRNDDGLVGEGQIVRVVIVRRMSPTVAGDADIFQAATEAAVATTRSRIPDSGSITELAGEIHSFVGIIISAVKI